jgi:hypothetical protein
MRVEMVEERPVKQLRGSVQLGGKPVSVLVEVFPETKNQSSSKVDESQSRVAVCRTGSDGVFCFPKLASGRYQIRCSIGIDAGIDVTFVDVVVDRTKGKNTKLQVVMQVGT